MRHKNRGTNDWGWQGVGPTLFLLRMIFWCATEMIYFCGAPSLVHHRYYFCGALVVGAPQNCIPSIRAFLLVHAPPPTAPGRARWELGIESGRTL
jgi:hypothetical protein